MHPMELLGDIQWNFISLCWETMLVSVQDRRTVCAKRTIGLEIILDTMMVLLRDDTQVDARFSPFGDSANVDAR